MKFKIGKLKIFSVVMAVLIVLQSWIFCPCVYAEYNRLMQVLNDSENLTVEDIRPLVEREPYLIKETFSDINGQLNWRTVVYYALYQGRNTVENRVAIARYLIEKGASMGPVFDGGDAPLHWAASKGEDAFVRFLLDRGVDPNQVGHDGITPLHSAASEGKVNCVKALLDGGADPNSKVVCITKVVLFAGAADPNSKYVAGDTPLNTAVRNGQVDCIKALLEGGADPNSKDGGNNTPLHAAVRNGKVDCIKALLEGGANPNSRNREGDTPLHVAERKGAINCAKALLDGGADPKLENIRGETPSVLASRRGEGNRARFSRR